MKLKERKEKLAGGRGISRDNAVNWEKLHSQKKGTYRVIWNKVKRICT